MSSIKETNGWNEWSKHVLKELVRLNTSINEVKREMHEVKSGLAKIAVNENQIVEIKTWKDNVSDIVSAKQLDDLVKSIEDLKLFKVKAITAFAVIQIVFGVAVTMISYFAG